MSVFVSLSPSFASFPLFLRAPADSELGTTLKTTSGPEQKKNFSIPPPPPFLTDKLHLTLCFLYTKYVCIFLIYKRWLLLGNIFLGLILDR